MKLEKFILDISSPFNLIKTKSGNISLRLIEGTSIEAIDIIDRINLHEELIEASKELLADVLNLLEKNNSVKLGTIGMLHIVRVQQAIKKATNNTQG